MSLMKRIIDRFKTSRMSLEEQAKYYGVIMGYDNYIASRFWSSEPYLITIGNHCALTYGSKIHTHGGAHAVYHKITDFDAFGKVTLGDYVYVGCYAQIMPGVTIGSHVLIAAGSIVTKSIPSDVVVAGNPARIICSLDDYIERNSQYNVSSRYFSREEKQNYLMSLSDEMFIHK